MGAQCPERGSEECLERTKTFHREPVASVPWHVNAWLNWHGGVACLAVPTDPTIHRAHNNSQNTNEYMKTTLCCPAHVYYDTIRVNLASAHLRRLVLLNGSHRLSDSLG